MIGVDPSDHFPLDVEERQFSRSALISEREMNEWQSVFVSAIVGIPPPHPEMSSHSMAFLYGKTTAYDIRKDRVLIGRSTKSNVHFSTELH